MDWGSTMLILKLDGWPWAKNLQSHPCEESIVEISSLCTCGDFVLCYLV